MGAIAVVRHLDAVSGPFTVLPSIAVAICCQVLQEVYDTRSEPS